MSSRFERHSIVPQINEGLPPPLEILTPEEDPYYDNFNYFLSNGEIRNHLDHLRNIATDPNPNRTIENACNFALKTTDSALHPLRLLFFASCMANSAIDEKRTNDPYYKAYIGITNRVEQYLSQGSVKSREVMRQIADLQPSIAEEMEFMIDSTATVFRKVYPAIFSERRLPKGINTSIFLAQCKRKDTFIINYPIPTQTNALSVEQYVTTYLNSLMSTQEIIKFFLDQADQSSKEQGRFLLPITVAKMLNTTEDPILKKCIKSGFLDRYYNLLRTPHPDQFNKQALNLLANTDIDNALVQLINTCTLSPTIGVYGDAINQATALTHANILNSIPHPRPTQKNITENKKIMSNDQILKNVFNFQTYITQKTLSPAFDESKADPTFNKLFANFLNAITDGNAMILGYMMLSNIRIAPITIAELFPDKSPSERNKMYSLWNSFIDIGENDDVVKNPLINWYFNRGMGYGLPKIKDYLLKQFGSRPRVQALINGLLLADKTDEFRIKSLKSMGVDNEILGEISELREIGEFFQTDEERLAVLQSKIKEFLDTSHDDFNMNFLPESVPASFNWKEAVIQPTADNKKIEITCWGDPINTQENEINFAATIDLNGTVDIIMPYLDDKKDANFKNLIKSLFLSVITSFLNDYKENILPQQIETANNFLEQFKTD